jgi:ABC-type nitrate/sulfonate/bicarbonate transport system substrate-binding protein
MNFFTAYVTSKTFLKNHPETVKKFMMAMVTAVHDYKAYPEIAIPLTQKFLSVKDADNMRAAYESYVKVYPDDLRPSLKGMELVLAELAKKDPKVAAMKPEQFADTSTLDALKSEGFFDKLKATN